MFVNEYQDQELVLDDRLLRKIQARWRGAVVRDSMRRVCQEYTTVFDEIEENRSCMIQWNHGQKAGLGKPQFVPVNRPKFAHQDITKCDELASADMGLSLVRNCGDKEVEPTRPDKISILTDSRCELDFSDKHDQLSLQQSNRATMDSRTDSPSSVIEQQGPELECNAGDLCRKREDGFKTDMSNCEAATVISDEALRDNAQTLNANAVSLVGSSLQEQRHNLALELLWVQQAIHSRKQYLRLKSQLAEGDAS